MRADELDRILDEALASYSLREPRAGLSGRVMARVRADGGRARGGWLWFAAGALAAVVIAIVIWRFEDRVPPVGWAHPPAVVRVEQPHEVPQHVEPMRVVNAKRPRLESIPAPAPLSPEERALIAFAKQAPAAALQLAQTAKPLEIAEIDIRPIQIDGLEIGEMK